MINIPKIKVGIVAVSRDCFPESLSVNRRKTAPFPKHLQPSAAILLSEYSRKSERSGQKHPENRCRF